MRTSYRVEVLLRLVAAAVLVAAVPVALAAGTSTYVSTAQRIDHDIATSREVDAVLDDDAKAHNAPVRRPSVPAHWTIDGVTHHGAVTADRNAKVGDTVHIRIGANGKEVAIPPRRAEAVTEAIAVTSTVLGVTALGAYGSVRGTRWLLDRRRCKQWAGEWLARSHDRKWTRS